MAQKAYFDKISVRKETRRMIECLATAYRAKIVDYVEGVMKA